MTIKNKIIKWILSKIFGTLTLASSCSNRIEWVYEKGPFEIKIIRRDTRKADTYSREELYKFALIIQSEQNRTGWDVFSCFR
jgi:hypothetical protein